MQPPPPPAMVHTLLEQTVLSPSLDEPHADYKNIVWCSTMQLVWNMARDPASGRAMLEPMPPLAHALNAGTATSHDIDADSCTLLAEPTEHGGMKLFAKIDKGFAFRRAFASDDTGANLRFRGQPVANFGVWQGEREGEANVVVRRYVARDDFIIQLLDDEGMDQLFVARMPPAATLADTLSEALQRIETSPPTELTLADADVVVIPKTNVELGRAFVELKKTCFVEGVYRGLVIENAEQHVDFKLDEHGAKLVSKAEMLLSFSAKPFSLLPREFICDGPFALIMQRRGAARPYLVAWIAGPELLDAR